MRLSILLTLLCCSATPGKFDYKPLQDNLSVRRMVQGSVSILNKEFTGPKTVVTSITASGVVVGKTADNKLQILFAYHTFVHVRGTLFGTIYVRLNIQDSDIDLPCVVVDVEEKFDLALLQTVQPWSGPDIVLKMSEAPPKRGDTVYVVGNPDRITKTVRRGVLSTEIPCENDASVTCWMTDAAVYFGNSGGGVYDDSGHLIGIALFISGDTFIDGQTKEHIIPQPGHGGLATWYTVGKILERNKIK